MAQNLDKPVKLSSPLKALFYLLFTAFLLIGTMLLLFGGTDQRIGGLGLLAAGCIGIVVTRVVRGLI